MVTLSADYPSDEDRAAELSASPPTTDPMAPAVDVYEDDDGLTLWADMPGVPKDQVSVNIKENTLTIEGSISLDLPAGLTAIHAEITSPRYQRMFTLSRELDADKVQASFVAGVLRLRIPKLMQERSRRIDVRVN
ncbi:Hsp20/alpha crystallin family protein [Paracandidimonas lactea]|uniref:Hsp20/alpha crystallin family protein n=1 Tax=Paracandidimonas lactea TaxID=2895524 RepID=UPI001F201260|nr:Hsp20/alpha crystallin family protein [Paracandidimonas lactea]